MTQKDLSTLLIDSNNQQFRMILKDCNLAHQPHLSIQTIKFTHFNNLYEPSKIRIGRNMHIIENIYFQIFLIKNLVTCLYL